MIIILSLQAEHGWAEKEVRGKYINVELQTKLFRAVNQKRKKQKLM